MKLRATMQDFMWGSVAVITGVVIIQAGDYLLGVKLEYYWGIPTFSFAWIADLILVPMAAGIAVSSIYGLGGKILAHLPPLIARLMSYIAISNGITPLPPDVAFLPMGFWGFIVIFAIEAGAAGGLIGEIVFKRIYGRRGTHRIYKNRRPSKDGTAPGAFPGHEK